MWITENWLKDIPQQFQGKKNIEILIRAFARQLEEVYQILMDINGKTDIETAYGVNLDHVGTIVKLSRKEAYELDRGQLAGESFPDGRYRIYMRYKILRDTSDCTYFDIMEAIDLLWDVKKASYYEREDRPATIFIGLPNVDVDKEDPAKGKPTVIRPGGVGFLYTIQYWSVIDHRGLERMFLRRVTMRMKMPFWACNIFDGTWKFDGSILMDAKRRYDLMVKVRCQGSGSRMITQEDVRLPVMAVHGRVVTHGEMDSARVFLGFDIDFFGPLRFNGSSSFDGVNRFDTLRHPMGAAVWMRSQVRERESMGNASVLTQRDPGYFDGSRRFDGTRTFNAIYREEEL